MRRGIRAPLTSIPLAVGGIVAGHALAYALAYPVRAVREAHLAQTGHEGFSMLLLAGLLVAGAAILWIGLRSIGNSTVSPSASMLLRLQVPAFVLLELGERGFDVAVFGHDPAVWIGVALQVVLAFVVAAIARGAVVVGQLVAGASPEPHRSQPTVLAPRLAEPTPPDPIAFGLRRAPPPPSLA